jgi:hypothetical protein
MYLLISKTENKIVGLFSDASECKKYVKKIHFENAEVLQSDLKQMLEKTKKEINSSFISNRDASNLIYELRSSEREIILIDKFLNDKCELYELQKYHNYFDIFVIKELEPNKVVNVELFSPCNSCKFYY